MFENIINRGHSFTAFKCNRIRCGTCQFKHSSPYMHAKTGKLTTNANMDCKSKTTNAPNSEGNKLSEISHEHWQQIRDPDAYQISLSNHLATLWNVSSTPQTTSPNEIEKIIREWRFINKFQPKKNKLS